MIKISINNYVKDLKRLIESKFKIQIPQSWLNPLLLEDFCGYNDLRKEQEEIWRSYLIDEKKNN